MTIKVRVLLLNCKTLNRNVQKFAEWNNLKT